MAFAKVCLCLIADVLSVLKDDEAIGQHCHPQRHTALQAPWFHETLRMLDLLRHCADGDPVEPTALPADMAGDLDPDGLPLDSAVWWAAAMSSRWFQAANLEHQHYLHYPEKNSKELQATDNWEYNLWALSKDLLKWWEINAVMIIESLPTTIGHSQTVLTSINHC